MTKYVLHYLAPTSAIQQAATSSATPEQKAEAMKPWLSWKDRMGENLIDFGSPLSAAAQLDPQGSSSAANNTIAGYSIIQAESLTEAEGMLEGHPHLQRTEGCSIGIMECVSM